MKINKVYKSNTDGFIVVLTPGVTYRYERMNLVPEDIKKWIRNHPDRYADKDTSCGYDD